MKNTKIYFNGSKFSFFKNVDYFDLASFNFYKKDVLVGGVVSGKMIRLIEELINTTDKSTCTISIKNNQISIALDDTWIASFNDYNFSFEDYKKELFSSSARFEECVENLLVETSKLPC